MEGLGIWGKRSPARFSSSGWDRSRQWSPTNTNLTGPDHGTDHEWYQGRMRYTDGWANDPSWVPVKES